MASFDLHTAMSMYTEYFCWNDLFPMVMQQDFLGTLGYREHNTIRDDATNGNLIVGSEVTFDLSLLPSKNKMG